MNFEEIPPRVQHMILNLRESNPDLIEDKTTTSENQDKSLLYLTQKSIPGYYFKILSFDKGSFKIEFKPRTIMDSSKTQANIQSASIQSYFKNWVNYIDEANRAVIRYNTLKSENLFENLFFDEENNDSKITPEEKKAAINFYYYLDENIDVDFKDSDNTDLEDLKKDIKLLELSIKSDSKQQVNKSLSKIIYKIAELTRPLGEVGKKIFKSYLIQVQNIAVNRLAIHTVKLLSEGFGEIFIK